MSTSKRVTVMIHTDDASASRSWRIPVWVFRAGLGVVIGINRTPPVRTSFRP